MTIFSKSIAAPQKTDNVVIYLSASQQAPPAPPFELQRWIPRDTWNARVPEITKTASRHEAPFFERSWFLAAVLSVIIVPVILYRVVLDALAKKSQSEREFFFEAKMISLALMIGVGLAFYLPIAIWKFIGNRRVAAMVSRWEREDRAQQGKQSIIPTWKVKTPGVFGAQIRLVISVPPVQRASMYGVTTFPAAYVNPPTSGPISGAPQVAVVNGMPVSLAQPQGDNPFTDRNRLENPFEDKNRPAQETV